MIIIQSPSGVEIKITGDDVAQAVDTWFVAHGVHVSGPRTITVNGKLCESGQIHIDPSGFVIADGLRIPPQTVYNFKPHSPCPSSPKSTST